MDSTKSGLNKKQRRKANSTVDAIPPPARMAAENSLDIEDQL